MEAGCGPDETVAAEYAPGLDCGGAGREAGAGGSVARGGGIATGPIPGPMTLVSCLFVESITDIVSKKKGRGHTGQDLLHDG